MVSKIRICTNKSVRLATLTQTKPNQTKPNQTKLNWTASGCLVRCLSLSQWLLVDQRHALCCLICTQCGRKNLSVHLPQRQTSVFIVELDLIVSANRHESPWGMSRSASVHDCSLKNILFYKAIWSWTECEQYHLVWPQVVSASSGFLALPRRGKQHSAVQRMFGKQPDTIRQLSVHQREFAYDMFRCRCVWFI